MLNKLTKLREERAEGDKGFTLIELLVVVVIIGILIAIAIPLYLNYQKGAKDKSAQSDVRSAVATIEQCFTDNGNNYPSAGTQASAGATMSFTATTGNSCGVANASTGTTLTYTPTCSATPTCESYVIKGYNSGGKRGSTNQFTYDSTVGGQVK
ncbi:hypothetical protein BH10ACT8_BH10ACT8_02940 [soil metagenome]|jgi:type IV pilus assembly protein PilA